MTVNARARPNSTSISSYGMLGGQPSGYLHGIWVSDTAWNTYGSYFGETQVNATKNAGGRLLCLAIDKFAWETNPSGNILGIPFQDYVKQLVEFFKPEKTILSLHIDSSYLQWHSKEKTTTIKTFELRQSWIQWGKDMIKHCKPWGILVMDEPPRSLRDYPITQAEYWDFANECVNEFRTVDPNIVCMTYGGGGSGNRDLSYFHDYPLPQGNILYTIVCYYNQFSGYETSSLNDGKKAMYDWLDNRLGPLKSETVVSVGVESPTSPNWRNYMLDVYEYNKANTAGVMQWACTKRVNWNMMSQDRVMWNEVGQFWADES